ncbi:MAG: META domain-containing protein [Bacteroidales bacterium]|nr:META domain-containing protein [Bacteroidales bacterium]
MTFATAINCTDSRLQGPTIHYLKDHFGVQFIDTIIEPGPNRILAEQKDKEKLSSILVRLKISIEKHESSQSAVIGQMAATEMYCIEPEDVMEQESKYLDILKDAETFDMTDSKLHVNCGEKMLVFVQQ